MFRFSFLQKKNTFCVLTDSNVDFGFTYDNLSQRKLYLDAENNIIVCGRESNKVCVIPADGKTNTVKLRWLEH